MNFKIFTSVTLVVILTTLVYCEDTLENPPPADNPTPTVTPTDPQCPAGTPEDYTCFAILLLHSKPRPWTRIMHLPCGRQLVAGLIPRFK